MTGIPLKGKAKGSAGAAFTIAKRRGALRLDFTRDYLVSLYAVCATLGIDADVLVAQWSVETGDGTSAYWLEDGNPAGLAAFDDGSNWGLTFTPETAAGAQAVHMARYLGMTVSASLQALDARWQAVQDAGYVGTVKTTADLGNGRWATDPVYSNTLLERYIAYWGEPQGDTTVNDPVGTIVNIIKGLTYTTTVPGLPGDPLLTTYPIQFKLIPAWNTYQRPGIKADLPRRSVQHGTGNPSSMAAGEITWLVDSQAGGGQVSFHATADDTGVWVGVPLDEVTWQAADGGGPGNMCGFSCEMIENEDMWANTSRRTKAIAVVADFMGRVAARLGATKPEQHWTFNWQLPPSQRHDCPNKLRYVNGAWDSYAKQWEAARVDELARMKGEPATPATPEAPAFDWSKAVKPIPIPALSKTDVNEYDTAAGVVSDEGTDFVFISDVLETIRPTKRLQFGDYRTSPSTGPDFTKGERFVGAWLFKSKGDGEYYALTPVPYWTRVRYTDTRRIADAPLKGTA